VRNVGIVISVGLSGVFAGSCFGVTLAAAGWRFGGGRRTRSGGGTNRIAVCRRAVAPVA
jgi:hypothetical protein